MDIKKVKKSERNQSLKKIEKLTSNGLSVVDACIDVGITQPTYYRWKRESHVKNGKAELDSKTAQHILDVAESHLANQGLNASLREISRAANISVGTIKYYFNSRSDLLYHITARGSKLFKDERFELLNEAESNSKKLLLTDIITAFYLPALKVVTNKQKSVSNYSHFLRRMIQSTDYEMQEIVHRCFSGTHKRFIAAFKRALPDLSDKQIYWRYIAFTGVYNSITQNPIRVNMITEGNVELKNPTKDLQTLMPILVSIMTGK